MRLCNSFAVVAGMAEVCSTTYRALEQSVAVAVAVGMAEVCSTICPALGQSVAVAEFVATSC